MAAGAVFGAGFLMSNDASCDPHPLVSIVVSCHA